MTEWKGIGRVRSRSGPHRSKENRDDRRIKHRLTGYISKIGDGQCTVNKIDSYELKDGGSVSTSTKLYIPVQYKENIPVTIRDVYENGSSYKDRRGNIQDLKQDSFVTIEGNYKEQIFHGEKIIIQIFH